jgi:propionate CoA-transferase
VEELGLDGLVTRYISGHVETAKSMLDLAERGRMDIHVLPQGEMTEIIAAQARGETVVRSPTGLDCFLDPRCGPGTAVVSADGSSLVSFDDGLLAYELPPIDVALFNAAYADRQGNVYLTDVVTLTETPESIAAARVNGGLAMAVVGGILDEDPSLPRIAADELDAVVVNPWNEQTVMARQDEPWRMFGPGGDGDDHAAVEKLRMINRLLHITPVRGPVEEALGRLGARLFSQVVPRGAHINIGVGFPEEVCREVYDSDLHHELVFTTETGVYGGLPAPGVYFGGAVNPIRLESSAWMFRFYKDNLDATVLGFLQVDSAGNVNVSRRGPRVTLDRWGRRAAAGEGGACEVRGERRRGNIQRRSRAGRRQAGLLRYQRRRLQADRARSGDDTDHAWRGSREGRPGQQWRLAGDPGRTAGRRPIDRHGRGFRTGVARQ